MRSIEDTTKAIEAKHKPAKNSHALFHNACKNWTNNKCNTICTYAQTLSGLLVQSNENSELLSKNLD